jgi:anti-sigma factor RsiW
MSELTCQELVELVTDYLDGALPEAERVRLEEHLAECPGCRAYVEQIRTTARLAGEAERLRPPPEMDVLLAAFRDFHRSA